MLQRRAIKNIMTRGLLLVLPVYLLWFLYIQFMPDYYNRPTNTRWQFIKESLEKKYIIPETNIIFLGESRVNAGLNFNKIPNSYSFASGGASSVELFYILEKYTENYPKPKKVFLSISPRFLSEIFAFYPYALRNNLLTYSDMREICSVLQENDTTLGTFPMATFILNKLNYIEYYQSDVVYHNVFAGDKENTELINEMIKRKGGRPHPGLKDSSSDLNYETHFEHFIPSELLTHYFNRIFNFCKEKDIDLTYFFMPMNESSFNVLKPAFVKEYKTFIKGFQKQYPEFNISDHVYFYPDSMFGDDSHLNSIGKDRYTKQFIKEYCLKDSLEN